MTRSAPECGKANPVGPMRFVLLAIALLTAPLAARAQLPTPTFSALTVNGPTLASSIVGSSIAISGPSSLVNGGSLVGTFTGASILVNIRPVFTTATTGTLPTALGPGDHLFVTDCTNGSQSPGSGTGCDYEADNNLVWQPQPTPPTQTVTIGGQGIFLGGSTLNQGTGNRIQLGTSATPGVNGQCAQFDANLNIVPSGGGCGASGGSGTVSSGLTNQIGFFAANGTTISGLATANSGVMITSGTGVPSISSTLPAITCPGCTLSAPIMTGTATASVLTMSGALNTAASAVGGANLNIPQGTTPTAPANGNVWATSAGLFGRYNGVTAGPYVGLAQISASVPIIDTGGVFSCTTCATTTNGGPVTATAPIAISAGGVISINPIVGTAEYVSNATNTVTNDVYPLPMDTWPWATGTIDSVTYYTGGTSTPSFSIALQINGVNVTTCNGITVSSATRATATCTAANAITTGQHPTLVISGVAGSPVSSLVQINYHHSFP